MRLNLGELITRLSECPKDSQVVFDFGGLHPTQCDSYRGYYSDLAVGFSGEGPRPSVALVIAMLKSAIGRTFTGWKGGDYRMTKKSLVWVANPGDTSDTVITSVQSHDYGVILHTAWEP